ncbi:hypothetical protein RvY_18799 [Ramazzottius varieornatus]|uniref:Uncharacterized protein n=1 Tax=Ramazzottius varieornatus TaxID=947166 RepID=A0A1D1W780_RAMVA|nr:hypothetical protein RvY_18799 [Ramazzottius varieornatus]
MERSGERWGKVLMTIPAGADSEAKKSDRAKLHQAEEAGYKGEEDSAWDDGGLDRTGGKFSPFAFSNYRERHECCRSNCWSSNCQEEEEVRSRKAERFTDI